MCTIIFGLQAHPKYSLIIAANRDEFRARPTSALSWWEDDPEIVGGRDLEANGTWMAMHRNGRFAALTNFREFPNRHEHAPTRGALVVDFLKGDMSAEAYLQHLEEDGQQYNGFNLIFGDTKQLWYYGNRSAENKKIESGIHGLSNAVLNTPWPKVELGKQELTDYLQAEELNAAALFSLLEHSTPFADDQLPQTGVPIEWERRLSSICIQGGDYGSKVSTVMLVDYEGNVQYIEKDLTSGSLTKEAFTITQ